MDTLENILMKIGIWFGNILCTWAQALGDIGIIGSWIASLGCLIVFGIIGWLMFRAIRKFSGKKSHPPSLIKSLFLATAKPIGTLLSMMGIYYAFSPLFNETMGTMVSIYGAKAIKYGIFIIFYWLLHRVVSASDIWLKQKAEKTEDTLDDVFAPLPAKALHLIMPIIAVVAGGKYFHFSEKGQEILQTIVAMMIIGAVAWFLTQVVMILDKIILARYKIDASDNLAARKIYTQIHVLQKIAFFLIGLFALASVLMLFDNVRQLGASILTSAGVIGIIFGFAAQRTIANLFAGVQIAFTQPIRLDDVVIVENEWGRIEEITLTYVVVRIWDQRRLILPISYFIEKPFQNWTRNSAEILGTIYLYMDYTVPVEEIRKELKRIVEENSLWDKRVCGVQVTDSKEKTLEVRALVSAEDASKLWDLRCLVREKLVEFIQKKHPHALPKLRIQDFEKSNIVNER